MIGTMCVDQATVIASSFGLEVSGPKSTIQVPVTVDKLAELDSVIMALLHLKVRLSKEDRWLRKGLRDKIVEHLVQVDFDRNYGDAREFMAGVFQDGYCFTGYETMGDTELVQALEDTYEGDEDPVDLLIAARTRKQELGR